MTSEREPWSDHDPFLDDLKRYFLDVAAFEADGEADSENNRSRLAMACYDMLEKLNLDDVRVIEGVEELLPSSPLGEFSVAELALEYKLVPLRLLNQRQPECPLPLEQLTPKRIEMIFNLSLAGEEVGHEECITGDESGSVACEQGLTCPMRLSRLIGKEVFELLVIQRSYQEDYLDPKEDPTCANLLQIQQSLVAHKLMLPTEIAVYRNLAYRYIVEQMHYMTPPDSPRTNDDTTES